MSDIDHWVGKIFLEVLKICETWSIIFFEVMILFIIIRIYDSFSFYIVMNKQENINQFKTSVGFIIAQSLYRQKIYSVEQMISCFEAFALKPLQAHLSIISKNSGTIIPCKPRVVNNLIIMDNYNRVSHYLNCYCFLCV